MVWGQLLTLTFELTLNLRQAGVGGGQSAAGRLGGGALRLDMLGGTLWFGQGDQSNTTDPLGHLGSIEVHQARLTRTCSPQVDSGRLR